jgi:hypothetical protein
MNNGVLVNGTSYATYLVKVATNYAELNSLNLPSTYQFTYQHTYPPTILQTYLLILYFPPTILHLYLPTYLPPTSHLPSKIPTYLTIYLLWIINYLLTYPSTYQAYLLII